MPMMAWARHLRHLCMHGSAMWLYGKRELSKLCEMMLCDFEGEPTELGKKVYNAIIEK